MAQVKTCLCSSRSFSDACPQVSASNHIDRCGSRFAESLGGWPSQRLLGTQATPGGPSPLWRSDFFGTWHLCCHWKEKLFPSRGFGIVPASCWFYLHVQGRAEGRLWTGLWGPSVPLCGAWLNAAAATTLPRKIPRVEDLAARVWRLWRKNSFIFGLGGGQPGSCLMPWHYWILLRTTLRCHTHPKLQTGFCPRDLITVRRISWRSFSWRSQPGTESHSGNDFWLAGNMPNSVLKFYSLQICGLPNTEIYFKWLIIFIFKGRFATTILESWLLKIKAEIFLTEVLGNYSLPGAHILH